MPALTDSAKDRVQSLITEETGPNLRILGQGGGCSGLPFVLAVDEPCGGDEVIEEEGFRILVDEQSRLYLAGVTVDDVETDLESGFTFENPDATGGCGCGQSFCG